MASFSAVLLHGKHRFVEASQRVSGAIKPPGIKKRAKLMCSGSVLDLSCMVVATARIFLQVGFGMAVSAE